MNTDCTYCKGKGCYAAAIASPTMPGEVEYEIEDCDRCKGSGKITVEEPAK